MVMVPVMSVMMPVMTMMMTMAGNDHNGWLGLHIHLRLRRIRLRRVPRLHVHLRLRWIRLRRVARLHHNVATLSLHAAASALTHDHRWLLDHHLRLRVGYDDRCVVVPVPMMMMAVMAMMVREKAVAVMRENVVMVVRHQFETLPLCHSKSEEIKLWGPYLQCWTNA
jgi:hypothetical protein